MRWQTGRTKVQLSRSTLRASRQPGRPFHFGTPIPFLTVAAASPFPLGTPVYKFAILLLAFHCRRLMLGAYFPGNIGFLAGEREAYFQFVGP